MSLYNQFSRQIPLNHQNTLNSYNYEIEKQFISKQKEWMKEMESKYHYKRQNYNNPYANKSKNQNVNKQINIDEFNLDEQAELEKTVKHKTYRQNLINNDNKSQITTKIVYYDRDQCKKMMNSQKKGEDQTNILSISQIKRLLRQSVDQTKIHKITSSASKNKIRTSGSNESKLSQKLEMKQSGSAASRYSKYINNQPLLNINIDLRKQAVQQNISGNILRNNLNRRRVQRIGRGNNQFENKQKFHSQLETQKQQIKQYKIKKNENQFCQKGQMKQVYKLQRSRSNLSKYCQIQQSKSRVSLNRKQQAQNQQNQNIKIATSRQTSLNKQNTHNKIHKICSSNYKSKEPQKQKQFFSQKKVNQFSLKQQNPVSQRKMFQTPRSSHYQIEDIIHSNLELKSLNHQQKKSSFNIRQNYFQEVPMRKVSITNSSKKARIKLSIFKK